MQSWQAHAERCRREAARARREAESVGDSELCGLLLGIAQQFETVAANIERLRRLPAPERGGSEQRAKPATAPAAH